MCVAKKEYTQIAHSRQSLDPECSTWIKFDMTRPSATHHAKRDLGNAPVFARGCKCGDPTVHLGAAT